MAYISMFFEMNIHGLLDKISCPKYSRSLNAGDQVMILLVEDDESTRETLSDFLNILHLEFTAVGTLHEALTFMRDKCPDILLTDLKLDKGQTSRPLIEHCKRSYPHCRSVLLTAMFRKEAEEAVKGLEIDYLVLKPFDMMELEGLLLRLTM